MQEFRNLLDMKDKIITTDAMGVQKDIAQKCVELRWTGVPKLFIGC